ncbi:MAG: hypothetical protein WDA16_06670 [Candidatus Thermoplasmatota archaeon]
MGFSTTVSHLVWGLALLGAASGVVAAYFTVEHAVIDGNGALDRRARDATLTRVAGTFCHSGVDQTVNITALNAGNVPISLGNTTLLLDGVVHAPATWVVVGAAASTDAWLPHESATTTLAGEASGPTRLTLVLPTGTLAFLTASCG